MQEGFFDYCSSLRRLKQRIPWGRGAFSLTQPYLPASLGSGGRLQRPLGAVLLPTKCTAKKTKSGTAIILYCFIFFEHYRRLKAETVYYLLHSLPLHSQTHTHMHMHMFPYSAGDYCVSLCGLSSGYFGNAKHTLMHVHVHLIWWFSANLQ